MPAVRVVDANISKPRKKILWEMLGDSEVWPHRIHDSNRAYFVIVNDEEVEKMLQPELRQRLKHKGFEVNVPLEYNANKTLIIRRLDPIIDEYTNDDIKESIEQHNDSLTVEEVYKFPTTAKILKIRLQSMAMVQKVLNEGLYILYQRVKRNQVEREIYVKLIPCANCFSYEHITSKCNQERLTLCAFCASDGHKQKDCTETTPCCINCGDPHRTLAAACPLRKRLIKEKRTSIRDRSRSRSIQRRYDEQYQPGGQSFASRTRSGVTSVMEKENKFELKKMTTILSAIAYSHYMEAQISWYISRKYE